MSLRDLRRAAAALAMGGLLSLAAAVPGRADPVADFYQGKDIRLIIGSGVGGGYDLESRLLAKYLTKYIPGHPTIVPQDMAGAGGMTAANYLYNVAPKDGTYIEMIMDTLVAYQAVGGQGVQFDSAKFAWLGTPEQEDYGGLYTWDNSGIKTVQDVMTHGATIGASAKGAITYITPQMMNLLLGTKLKIITGYDGSATINMALERGDIQTASAGDPHELRKLKPDWFKTDPPKVRFLIAGVRKDPATAGLPTILQLAKSDADRKLIALVMACQTIGRPLVAPPGVPADRVAALRSAFDKVVKDPDYLKQATTAGFVIDPLSGAQLQKFVLDVLATPPAIMARAKPILDPNG